MVKLNCLMWNPIFVVSNHLLCHACLIKKVYRTSFGGKALFRVESSELNVESIESFAAGIQQPVLRARPFSQAALREDVKSGRLEGHLTGNGEGPHVRFYRWRGIPPPL